MFWGDWMDEQNDNADKLHWTNKLRDAIVEFVQTHDCDCSGPSRVVVGRELAKQIHKESWHLLSPGEQAYAKDYFEFGATTSISTLFGEIPIRYRKTLGDFEFEVILDEKEPA